MKNLLNEKQTKMVYANIIFAAIVGLGINIYVYNNCVEYFPMTGMGLCILPIYALIVHNSLTIFENMKEKIKNIQILSWICIGLGYASALSSLGMCCRMDKPVWYPIITMLLLSIAVIIQIKYNSYAKIYLNDKDDK